MADSLTVQPRDTFSISQTEPDATRPALWATVPDDTKPEIKLPAPAKPEAAKSSAPPGWTFVDDLPPNERAEVYSQMTTPPPSGDEPLPPGYEDVVEAFKGDPKGLAEATYATKGDINLRRWALENPDKMQDPQIQATIADAMAMQKERGFKTADIKWGEAGKALLHLPLDIAKWGSRAADLITAEVGQTFVPKLTPKAQAEFDKEQAKQAAELVTGTNVGLEGLAGLIDKGASKTTRKLAEWTGLRETPTKRTAQEKLDDMNAEIEAERRRDLTARGHGVLTQLALGGVMKDLERDGVQLDPEAVNTFAAGDPVTFIAFGEGFKILGSGGKLIGTATSRGQAISAMNKLRAVQQAAAKAGADHSAALNAAGAMADLEQGVARTAAGKATAPIPGELPLTDSAFNAGRTGTATDAAFQAAEAAGQKSAAAQAALAAAEERAGAASLAARSAGRARAISASATASQAEKDAANSLANSSRLPGAAGQVARIADATANIADWAAKSAAKATEFGIDKTLGLVAGGAGAGVKAAQFGAWAARGVAPNIVGNRALTALPTVLGKAGDKLLERSGALLKGTPERFGPYTQLISDTAKAGLVDVPAGMAKGAVMDASLAAITNETPQDNAASGIMMTALGGLEGIKFGGARVYQGQQFNEHNYGSRAAVRDLGNFADLDAATETSLQNAEKSPGTASRLAAMREMFGPANVEMHLVTDPAQFAAIVQKYLPGMTGEALDNAREAGGVNIPNAKIPGTNKTRNLAIFSELSAGEHEGVHGWQQAFSKAGLEKLNQLARTEYAPEWEQIGRGYMARIATPEQMARYAANGEGWREALIDFTQGSPEWRNEGWTEEQIIDTADNYIANEVVADVGASILQANRGSLEKAPGFPGKLARILGSTYEAMGVNPFNGAQTGQVGIPLKHGARENIRKELINARKTIGVDAVQQKFQNAIEGKPEVSLKTPSSPAGKNASPSEIAASAPNTPAVRGGRTQQEIAQDFVTAIGEGTAVAVDYHHAPGDPAGAVASNRQARRDIIELNREAPNSVRPLWEKNFWPESMRRTQGGEIQIQGWSPEVFAANAHKLAKALNLAGEGGLSPYEIDIKTGSFTEAGWQELFADAQDYSRNQIAGLTGAGEPIVVPMEVQARGFHQPPVEGTPGRRIDQNRADVISYLMGIPTQKTGRVVGNYPRNLASAAVSEATLPGRTSGVGREFSGKNAEKVGVAGQEIQEVNPFRATLEQNGIQPSVVEAVQQLNLGRIADVSHNPAAPEVRGREFTVSAGFAPKGEKNSWVDAALDAAQNPRSEHYIHGSTKSYNAEQYEKAVKRLKNGYTTEEFKDFPNKVQKTISNLAAIAEKQGSLSYGRAYYPKSLGEDSGARFAPKKVSEWTSLEPKDVLDEIKAGGKPLTPTAWELGKSATPDEVTQLKSAMEAASKQSRALLKEGKIDDAMAAAMSKQFFNEAVQMAEGKVLADPVPAKFAPKTEAGKALEEKGFSLEHTGYPGFRSISVRKDGKTVGEILSSVNTGDMERVHVAGVDVDKNFRNQGIADTLYRELFTDLQADGVTLVDGYVVHPAPIKTREKLLGEGMTSYYNAGKPISVEQALRQVSGEVVAGPRAVSALAPDIQFSPKSEKGDKNPWVDGALAAARNPRGEHYIHGSTKSYNAERYDQAVSALKNGYTTKEFKDFPNGVQKTIRNLANIAEKQKSLSYGRAYYPKSLGEDSGASFAPKSDREDASGVVGKYTSPKLTQPAGSVGKGFNPPEKPRVDNSALGLPVEGVDNYVRYAGEDAGLTPHRFSPSAKGSDVTQPSPSYKDAADLAKEKGGNLWVRQSPETSNEGRVLMVQITPDLMYPNGPDPVSTPYYDKLYSGARKGYERAQDFWELPQWAAVLSHNLGSKADFYAVRDVAEAQKFLDSADYDRVAFSVMDVSKQITEKLLPHIKGTADLGGYAERADLAERYPNAKVWNDVNSFVADVGLPYKKGFDYRLFRGTEIIPRLELSAGCRHRCTFCTIDRKVTNSPMEEVNQQVDSFADLNGKLVYLNDKTFGQSPNVKEMPRLYKEMKAANPEFDGFVIQTTAAQMKLFTDDFLKDAGIRYIELGVETYNDPILKTLRKPATEALIDDAVEKMRRNGINFIPNIVIGFPGETSASYGRTMDFLRNNEDVISHVNTYNLAVYKGTEISEKIKTSTAADADENSPNKSFYTDPKIHEDFAKQVYDYGTERLGKPSAFAPKLENAANDVKSFDAEHLSSMEGLKEINPKYFGRGKATPTDMRGGNKSYFFVKGSKLGQDEPIFGQKGLHKYTAQIPGDSLYDLRKGKPDPLEWRKTVNREEADDNVAAAGYKGMVLDTQDGRQVIAMFKKTPVKQVEKNAIPSDEEITSALSTDKQPYVGAHRDLEPGTPVGLRIDIPAYERNGTYVITIHEKNKAGQVGKRIGYDSIAAVDNPTFFSNERGAERVRAGAPKFPLATVEGEFNPTRKLPRDLTDWTEVGFNPERHSYFYDKQTDEPVTAGSKAISVGNSVWVKDAEFGNKKDFAFAPSSNPRAVAEAAVRYEDGKIFTGAAHYHAYDRAAEYYENRPESRVVSEGFVTHLGEYLSREEAYDRAVELGQLDESAQARLAREHRRAPQPEIPFLEADTFNETRQFSPKSQRGETEGLPGLDVPREVLSPRQRADMSQKELREYFPEAIVPRDAKEKIESDIVGSPLYKKFKTEPERVEAFSKRLVDFANQYKDNPAYDLGARWYSEFTPMLKKTFGKDAEKMAELLAATSPQTGVETNFGYAFDALESWNAGRFDKIIPKFEEGLSMMEDGRWERWLKRNDPEATQSPAQFMAQWIEKHNLKPTQSNGKLYGQHSLPVLQVFARRWMDKNSGPKTRNFVGNLLGTSEEATIDLWADRTMRWAGYEGAKDRWRIPTGHNGSISDADYAFSEKVFRHAAEELGMRPDALQGALWFAEKQRWADNGWGRLDLGNFQNEMEKIPLLREGVKQRLGALEAKKKAKPTEQLGFDISPRFK